MKNLCRLALLIALVLLPAVAIDQEDAVADTIAAAFVQARQAAHLPKLQRIDRNPFREQVCNRDMRFMSGLIRDVVYQTSHPEALPESAQRLARTPDSGKTAVRFGIGVCMMFVTDSPPGSAQKYAILIALYESRWTSFWRNFWG